MHFDFEFALLLLIGYILWILVKQVARSEHLKRTSEFNSRLLDRIGSGKEFSDFLQTEAGAKFMNSLGHEGGTVSRATGGGTPGEILRTMQIGIVLLTLGLGLVLVGQKGDEFVILGMVALSLGVGFLIATAASYRLAKALGVLDDARQTPQ